MQHRNVTCDKYVYYEFEPVFVDKFDVPRQIGGIYGAGPSLNDLRQRQKGGLYGAGTSLDVLPDKTGENVGSPSESDEDDSELINQIMDDKTNMVDGFCRLDICREVIIWCGARIGKEKSKFVLNNVFELVLISRAIHHDDVCNSIMQTME